jgi:deoxycytidine triphosphate deaminase
MIYPPNYIFSTMLESFPIENLASREHQAPEGVGFDLRLKSVHLISGSGTLLETTRKTSDSQPVQPNSEGIFILDGNKFYLVTTEETMHLPENMAGIIFPRSTLFRSGVALHTSVVPSGYVGPLTFGLTVLNNEGFTIQRLARFCHIVLFGVENGATPYRGQWSGGRITHNTDEEQI